MNIINQGVLKLKNDLSINYGLYTGSKYIELSEFFNELVDNNISIEIVNIKNNKILLKENGILYREKINKQYILKINDKNIDNILWDLVDKKIKLFIKSEGEDK